MLKQLMSDFANDEWGIKRLQNCILNIAQYLHNFCEEYGIEYCLMGGSALGAVRHKGFIPWDDDLDIFMTPSNYEKFRHTFYENGDKAKFYLQEKGKSGLISTAKLRYNYSTYIEDADEDKDINHGVFIDIFILHTCPDNVLKRYWQYSWARYLILKGLVDRGGYSKSGTKNFVCLVAAKLPHHFLVSYALKQLYRYQNDSSSYLCHFLGHATMKNALYKRDYFEGTKRLKFEEIEMNVPIRVENYLRDRWGDFMKLPPRESIKHAQHCKRWSDNETFPNYNAEGLYKDEADMIP